MDTTMMTLDQIRQAGLQALSKELGAIGLICFLQQFETGQGDYTTERHLWLDGCTIQEIAQEISSNQQDDKV